jgi:phosphoribosylformylglycinamidine cyclo-ligase
MIVNDLITLGISPAVASMYLPAGRSEWFEDERRWHDLSDGWATACGIAGCTWGGGETPISKGVILPGTFDLAGDAFGFEFGGERMLFSPNKIQDGDAIVFLGSSGIHANGLTLAREIGDRRDSWRRRLGHVLSPRRVQLTALPKGYLTELPGGRTYGETLLDPTPIYVRPIEALRRGGVDVHYGVNITGHGLRKLMRASRDFTYVVEKLPRRQPIFEFIKEHGPVEEREMFATFNMGMGFALYVPTSQAEKAVNTLRASIFPTSIVPQQLTAWVGGHIEAGPRRVVIKPKNIEFRGSELGVR